MIFSELYSAYYTTVARILEAALRPGTTERELQGLVQENAFSESVLTILPSLRSGKWPLLKDGLTPVVEHAPTLPLTLLEKRWLKAICEDPRVRLFGVELPELADVEPLFTREDYRIYDLTAYEGTGEGYMPIREGMERHYTYVNGTPDVPGGVSYYYIRNNDGELVLLADQVGMVER